jgi:hypothetical protein
VRNARGLSKPPIDDIETYWTPTEKAEVQQWLAVSVYGSPDTVRGGIERLLERTKADELMIVCDVFDHTERLHSFELIAEAVKTSAASESAFFAISDAELAAAPQKRRCAYQDSGISNCIRAAAS